MGINHTHAISCKLFKYHGGKSNMLKHILPLIPNHDIYIEPFAGSAVVFFSKKDAYNSILNDKNNNIVNFYQIAKKYPEDLIRECDAVLQSESLFEQYKLCLKDEFAEPFAKAVAFWGLCTLEANVGKDKFNLDLCINAGHDTCRGAQNLRKCKELLKQNIHKLEHAQILNRDAVDVIKTTKNAKNAFYYLDPPYINTQYGSQYAPYSESDYRVLLDTLSNTDNKFMLSSYPNPILQEYIEHNNWRVKSYTKLLVAGIVKQGNTRTATKTELLVMNYEIRDLFNQ